MRLGIGCLTVGSGYFLPPKENLVSFLFNSTKLGGRVESINIAYMQLTMMRAKIHRATITQADLHYEGSISIDENLLEASGILLHEKVDVLNISNGQRFTTYTIAAPKDSGEVKVNGAAARLVHVGDPIIIIAYGSMSLEEAKTFQPKVVLVGKNNGLHL